jgi:hypothetical protein
MEPKELKAMLLVAAAQLAAGAVGNAASVQAPNAAGVMATIPVTPDTAGQDPGLRAKELILANKTTDFYVWLLAALNDGTVFIDPPTPATVAGPAPGNITAAGLASFLATVGKAAVVSSNPAIAASITAASAALQLLGATGAAAAPPVVTATSPLASVLGS